MLHTKAPLSSDSQLIIHNIWKEKAAVPVKWYEMDVEVGRCVCWDGTVSIKRLDSLSNPKLFPDELVPSSAEHWLNHSWNSHSNVITLHSPSYRKFFKFYELHWNFPNSQRRGEGTSFTVLLSEYAYLLPNLSPHIKSNAIYIYIMWRKWTLMEVWIYRWHCVFCVCVTYAFMSAFCVHARHACICNTCMWLY